MGADKDIVERLQSAGHFYAPPHDAILYEATAEIVRLRGEACSCPSGDGSLRWPCKAHPPESIAPAEAKGEGELPTTDAEVEADNAKAADRARPLAIANGYVWDGAAWVKPPTHQPAAGEVVADVVLHDGLLYGRLRGDLPVGTKLYTAPAAVPAGEANGDAPAGVLEHLIFSVDRVANSGDYGLCDQAVVQLNYAIEDARRGIGTGTPQPADGEAVAYRARGMSDAWVYADKPVQHFINTPWEPLYTHPPAAPVQAAPQEGEASRELAAARAEVTTTALAWGRNLVEGGADGGKASAFDDAVERLERAVLAARPSACELEAVRELVKVWRGAVNSASTTNKQDLRPERFIRELEAALQHRGDSQEVGRG